MSFANDSPCDAWEVFKWVGKKILGESYADRIGILDQYFDRRISDPNNLLSSFRVHHLVGRILT